MAQNYEAEKIEAQKRFEILPENLKKEMLADKNVQLISSICQDYKIPEEDVKKVALLVGEVFLGYIKPEEISSELNKYFGVELQKSNFVEIELKQKLFNPLKAELEKVYNPPKIEEAEEIKEAAPAIIKLEKEAAPISAIPAIPLQKPSEIITEKKTETKTPSPFIIGSTPIKDIPVKTELATQPIKTNFETPTKKEIPVSEGPFVIQTKTEAVKPLTPQFPKETPSLNLKVDESLIQKAPIIKPVSVHLESEQQIANGPKFQMPVTLNKPTVSQEQKSAIPAQPTVKTAPVAEKTALPKTESPKIEIPIKTSPIPAPATGSQTLKQLSEQQTVEKKSLYQEEPVKTVHYSNFKTPLSPSGLPKKPEPAREFINLSTFTKVSGNTVDLRQQQDKK